MSDGTDVLRAIDQLRHDLSGYYRPAHDDGFCAWAEKREDEHMDLRELDAIADAMDGGDE